MKQQFFHGQQSAPSRRAPGGIPGMAAVGLPPLLRTCRITGNQPLLDDAQLRLAGTTLQFVWFESSIDRSTGQSPIVGAELRIESCERHRISPLVRGLQPKSSAGSTVNRTIEERAERYSCRGVLIEYVEPGSVYGDWLRLQGSTDEAKLNAQMKDGAVSISFDIHMLVAVPSGKEVTGLKLRHGLELAQGQRQIICPEVRGNLDRYSDMQIDRLFEAFKFLSILTRLQLNPAEGFRDGWQTELNAIEAREANLLQELKRVYDELRRMKSEYSTLCASNALEEARLRGLVVANEGLSVEEAQTELDAKKLEFGLQAAIVDERTKGAELKALKKKIKNQQDARLVHARTAEKEAEGRRKAIEQRLRPFEQKVRDARKVDRGPQQRLEAFLRDRTRNETALALRFNSLCTNSRPLWKQADDAYMRRAELLCLLSRA